jgi:hypothetical protein
LKDAYYFSHDSNARNDEKSMFIRNKYGTTGYGLYWMFVESMHEQADGRLTCDLLEGLALSFNTDITLIQQFYNDAIKIKLFVTDGEKYWSERVLRNKKELEKKRKQKSKAGKKGMAVRWNKDNTVITDNNTDITEDNKGKESKGKESKENKKIYIEQFFESVWSLYPNKKGKGKVSLTQKQKLYDIGFEEIKRCIERYEDTKEEWKEWQHGSTFFNSGYVDYLDKNFEEEKTPVIQIPRWGKVDAS